MMDMETEEATFRTVRSELEQSLKTSTTQHASLQAHHTEVQKEIVLVKDQHKKCMETNLELLEKLHKAEARFLTDKSIKVSKQLSTGKASKRNQPRPSSEHGVAQKVNCPRLGVCLFVRFLSEQSVPDVVNWKPKVPCLSQLCLSQLCLSQL
jgi:predicted nucleotide-binding protein (sugar kinase/HSP70/actin superfamily)